MQESIKNDILSVLNETQAVLNKEKPDAFLLKKISDHVIHNTSIYQDEDSISIAVLVYSLSKIIERVKNSYNFSQIKQLISDSIEYLEDDNVESYQDFIRQIFSIIQKLDSKYKFYVEEVIKQASLKKSSRIYEHGISAAKTAQILGVSLWDLYTYLGATNISDQSEDISNVRDRLKFARSLFQKGV
jgi:hypothetical protein